MRWFDILGIAGFSLILISNMVEIFRAIRQRQRQRLRIAIWSAFGIISMLLAELLRFGGYRQWGTVLIVLIILGIGSVFYSFYLWRKSSSDSAA
jgi:hypothetical protein